MSPEDLAVSLQGMFGGLPPAFTEAWGTETAAIVRGFLYDGVPDGVSTRSRDEALEMWSAFHRDGSLTNAEWGAKNDAFNWALFHRDAWWWNPAEKIALDQLSRILL